MNKAIALQHAQLAANIVGWGKWIRRFFREMHKNLANRFVFCCLPFHSDALADDSDIPAYSHEYLKSEMDRCLSIDGFSKELCGRVIATANKMTENDDILYIFIENAKNKP